MFGRDRMKRIFILIVCLFALFTTSCKNTEIIDNDINVPVYAGMSVSDTVNVSEVKSTGGRFKPLSFVQAADVYDYTATVGDTIYINVLIDNPDEYEIISLKLNGTKYVGNYQQFEVGTTAEKVIIKLNVGNTPEVKTYTVSDIKWINGTTIEEQNVLMEGGSSDSISVQVNAVVPVTPVNSGRNFTDNIWYDVCFSKVTISHEFYINSITFRYNDIDYVLDITNIDNENDNYWGWAVDLSGRIPITFDFDYRLIGATEWTNRVVTETCNFDF